MNTDDQHVAEMIKSGAYFEQSRKWYQTLYISPISERSFFLIVAVLAGLIGIIGFFAVVGLLPITVHAPVVLRADRMDEAASEITPLKQRGQPMNEALIQFFLNVYVQMREGYTAKDYDANYAFVHAHSDAATAAAYAAAFGRDNPRSPGALLGEGGVRTVTVESIDVDSRTDPMKATVNFATELGGTAPESKTQWTAAIQFYYSDLAVIEDKKTGETTTQEPTFQVVSYELRQNP